ncbi:MAG: CvpA family protein [candidate division WOR-3 bacterium]
MTEIDFLVISIIILSVFLEAKEGFFNSLKDLLSALGSIFIGIITYQITYRLSYSFNLGIISFLVSAFGFLIIIYLVFRNKKDRGKSLFSRIGGGISGFFLGIGASLATLIILSLFFPVAVEEAKLGNKILDLLPKIYYLADRVDLQFPMLKNAYTKEWENWDGQFRERINFSHLDRSTCIQCRGKVRFEGYFRKGGALVSPLFICEKCGRKSDGCQTFEGFHKLYNKCPIDIAQKGMLLDCGVWASGVGVFPKGQCPVCGKRLLSDYRH